MEKNERISVIVPVYKVEAYLNRCVDSILAQTYRDLEVILVDDGSPDNCGAICDGYAAADSRVRVIHKENGGLSSARNAGMEIATGEYITFVDSDDWIEPEAYAHLLSVMKKYDVKLVCGGRYDVKSATGEKKVGLCPQKEEKISAEEMVGRIFLWDGCDSAAWDKLYHRSVLEGFQYPLGKICEDVPVTYKIVLKAQWVAMSDKPYYNYFHRPGSITTASVSEKTFHFSRHTEEILKNIRENLPGLEPQARYFRVRSLMYNLIRLETADAQSRKAFAGEYRGSRRDISRHVTFALGSPYFTRQEKITVLLMALGLYRWLRPLYHKLKGV